MGYVTRKSQQCLLCDQRKAIGRGLCRPCYINEGKDGNLGDWPVINQFDAFESRIKKTNSCWIWTGTKNGYGYGIFLLPGEVQIRAHRYAYEHFVSKIPSGKIIMHTCDNPPCVNPRHLRIGTKGDNNKDTAIKRRHHYGTDHWNGKLTDEQVKEICKSKESAISLAKKYGINRRYVYALKAGGRAH